MKVRTFDRQQAREAYACEYGQPGQAPRSLLQRALAAKESGQRARSAGAEALQVHLVQLAMAAN